MASQFLVVFVIGIAALFILPNVLSERASELSETKSYTTGWTELAARKVQESCEPFLAHQPFVARFSTSIAADGSIQKVEIKLSSGKPGLEVKLVQLLQSINPLPPFSQEQRKKYDVLEIENHLSIKNGKCQFW